MSLQLLVLLLALVVENEDLVCAAVAEYLADHVSGAAGARNVSFFGRYCQNFTELNLVVLDWSQFLDPNYIAGCDAILLSPGADDRVHNSSKTGHTSTATSLKITLALHRARTAAAAPIGIPRSHSQQAD